MSSGDRIISTYPPAGDIQTGDVTLIVRPGPGGSFGLFLGDATSFKGETGAGGAFSTLVDVQVTPGPGLDQFIIYYDATAGFFKAKAPETDILFFAGGTFGATELLFKGAFPRMISFATNFGGSVATLEVATTAASVFTLYKNGSAIGTINFTAGATVGTFNAAPVSFAIGDVLKINAQTIVDNTAASLAVTLKGQ